MPKSQPKASRRGAGRVAFLAQKEVIQSLLDQGYSQRTIFNEHCATIGVSYAQFTRYVASYLTKHETRIEQQNGSPSSQAIAAPLETKTKPGQVGRKFEHNPVPSKNLI
jgi:hypothetical protein